MSQTGTFTDWTPKHSALYSHQPMRVGHNLHTSQMFTDDGLARLIERVPRSHYHVVYTGPVGSREKIWREGRMDGLSGHDVIDAVRNGQIWVSLERVEEIDAEYREMLEQVYADIEDRVDGLNTFKKSLGLLISSPKAQVYYHCDIPGQSLWQVRGRKRVYVYPNTEPFLTPEFMETIILGETEEEGMPYAKWYDEHAQVFEIGAGDMLHWPLNAPHRVENMDCLNVSFTTEHWTRELRNSYAVHYANGILRRWAGARNLARQTGGMALYAKMALAAAVKYSGLNRARDDRFLIDFEVDPSTPTGTRDIPAYHLPG